MKKYTIVLFIFLMLTILVPTNVFAGDTKKDNLNTVMKDMKPVGTVNNASGSSVGKIINVVIKLIQIAGSGIAVIMVTMLGIKYMLASSNEKADIKKQAVPVVVGCVILFAAVNIVGLVADIGTNLNNVETEKPNVFSFPSPQDVYDLNSKK